jgi:hypothetical protein
MRVENAAVSSSGRSRIRHPMRLQKARQIAGVANGAAAEVKCQPAVSDQISNNILLIIPPGASGGVMSCPRGHISVTPK